MLVVCAALILGGLAILAFEHFRPDLERWLEANVAFLLEHPTVVLAASLLAVAPILAASGYLLLIGSRTVRAQRFPPPGLAVVRDTPVLIGASGVRRGRLIKVLAALLLLSTAAIPFVMWSVFRTLAPGS